MNHTVFSVRLIASSDLFEFITSNPSPGIKPRSNKKPPHLNSGFQDGKLQQDASALPAQPRIRGMSTKYKSGKKVFVSLCSFFSKHAIFKWLVNLSRSVSNKISRFNCTFCCEYLHPTILARASVTNA
jgi:hypothetical protein